MRPLSRFRGLAAVWLGGLALETLAYRIVEGVDRVDGEGSLFEMGMAVVLFTGPFYLAAYTFVSRWKLIRRNPQALAAVWGVGAAACALAWFVDRRAGFTQITNLLFMARSVLVLAPYFLGLFTLVWLFDRWGRVPSARARALGSN